MHKKRIPDSVLVDVEEKIKNGASIQACAVELGLSRPGLSARLSRYRSGEREASPKQIKKLELKDSELSVVNQLEGRLGNARDEINSLKRQLIQSQKNSITLREVANEIRDSIEPFEEPPKSWQNLVKGPCQESVVLHLSDGHHDAVIHPHMVRNLENHNFDISMARAETLVDSVLEITKNRMVGYNFDTLWILAYGDHTNGEIHGSVEHSHFGNMMRNCLAIGQLHGQMIRDFSEWFTSVKVLYLSGNHGRRKEVRKKDYHHAWDSWDYLIGEIARAYCGSLFNVEFLIPDSFSAVVDIEGYKFCCFHGDDIKGWNGIPWYGIERKTRRLTALNAAHDSPVNYYCLGHFHALGTQAALKGETLINGSWVGTSPFCFNAMDGYNEPMQLLHGVHAKRGLTWRLPIKVRSENEVNGPKRYKYSLSTH